MIQGQINVYLLFEFIFSVSLFYGHTFLVLYITLVPPYMAIFAY